MKGGRMKTSSERTILNWIADHTHDDKEYLHIVSSDNIKEKLKGFECRVCNDIVEIPVNIAKTILEVEKLMILTCRRADYIQAKKMASIIKMFRMLD